jgi:phage-related protein
MLDTDFYLDGVSARSKGIYCGSPVSFSAAVPRISAVQIPGRSGDLLQDDGGYYNISATVDCFTMATRTGSTAMTDMKEVAGFLFSARGYRRLTTYEDPDHYWLAYIKNAAEIAPRLNFLNPFNVEWECKPYAYLTGYDEKITAPTDEAVTVENPTIFKAYPIYYIDGETGATIGTNNGYIQLTTGTGGLIYDTETERAYGVGGGSLDDHIATSGVPFFNGGSNRLLVENATVQYIPRWREIL